MAGLSTLHIIPRLPTPPNDGGAVYIYYMIKALAERGNDITIAAFLSNLHEQDESLIKPYADLYTLPVNFKSYTPTAALKSTLHQTPVTVYHRMDRQAFRKLISQIDSTFDVILLEGLHTYYFIDLITHYFPGTPVILRESNVEHEILSSNASQENNPLLKIFYYYQAHLMKRFEKRAISNVQGVTAISKIDKQKLEDLNPNIDCFVSPPGAELPDETYNSIPRKERTLLTISNWSWRPNFKGLQWFLDKVWPLLTRQFNELTFQVIGKGLPETFIRRYQSDKIEFLGFIDNLEHYKARATAFIVPVFSGSGVKIKILEALAGGVPLVTTSLGARGINIEHENHYLEAESPENFKRQVEKLLTDPILRERLSSNAQTFVHHNHNWAKLAADFESFLKRFTTA